MSMAELLKEELRLTVLMTLKEAPGQSAYEGLLQTAVNRYQNQFPTREEVRDEIRWLRDAGLVSVTEHPSPNRISLTATLTEKGEAVASGRIRQVGVRRPDA